MSEQTTPPDWYGVLGVAPDALQSQIDRAYRTRVRWYHPDSRPVDGAVDPSEADTNLLNLMAAYRVIGHPDRRADYDQRRRNRAISSRALPIRVRMPDATDGFFVVAGPVQWSPPLNTHGSQDPSSRP